MSEIKPMAVRDMPKARAIALPPSLELDLYMMLKVLDGPEDFAREENFGRLPGFSRRFGDAQMLLIKAINELGPLNFSMDPSYFPEAKAAGFFMRETPCVTWRVSCGSGVAYGRSFGEALCKMLIVANVKG